ncbi:hypothetical protein ABZP36_019621, partial [Zizania latifolia]
VSALASKKRAAGTGRNVSTDRAGGGACVLRALQLLQHDSRVADLAPSEMHEMI